MKCQLCRVKLAPLRVVSNGLFCSDEHREAYEREQASYDNVRRPLTALIPLDWWIFEPASPVSACVPDPDESLPFYPDSPQLPAGCAGQSTSEIPWSEALFALS